MKLPVFLDKLTEIKFIYLDFDYTGKSVNSRISMRKIKFFGNGAKIESFVALESLPMHNEDEKVEVVEYFIEWLDRPTKSWVQFCARYVEWICFVMVLVKCHASPQKVTITDSEVHGKMVIGDEHGVNLDIGVLNRLLLLIADCIVRYERVPVLRLPLSGYEMKWVVLVIATLPENSGAHAKNLDEIEFWDYEDELPVFREAVKEFLKEHKDTFTIMEK